MRWHVAVVAFVPLLIALLGPRNSLGVVVIIWELRTLSQASPPRFARATSERAPVFAPLRFSLETVAPNVGNDLPGRRNGLLDDPGRRRILRRGS